MAPKKEDKEKEKGKYPSQSSHIKKTTLNERKERNIDGSEGEEEEDQRFIGIQEISAMLKDLKLVFKSEIRGAVAEIKEQISELGERTSNLEKKCDQLDELTNHLECSTSDHNSRILQLETKVEDLENRSRRANLRLRGIPEEIKDLQTFALDTFCSLLPEIQKELFLFDRIHRALYKPRNSKPRDVILKLHYPEVKDQILRATRVFGEEGIGQYKISIFQDLSPITIAKRRHLKPLTSILKNNNILYRWNFPFSLTFKVNEKPYSIQTLPEGQKLFSKLKLTNNSERSNQQNASQEMQEKDQGSNIRKKTRHYSSDLAQSPPKSYRRIQEEDISDT